MKLFILLCATVLCTSVVSAGDKNVNGTEQITVEPSQAETVVAGNVLKTENPKAKKTPTKQFPGEAQPHTIADFIIHPVIALKPRAPEGKQAKQAEGSSTTPSPWQLFGFNAGQGLGSSVSSLAGTVTGWLGNRIQLPTLVDTPIREYVPTTSTTTTIRPNVVVRIQKRPSTKKPLNSISNKNEPPFRRFERPNLHHVVNYVNAPEESDDSIEYNDYYNFAGKRRRYQNYEEDDEEQHDAGFESQENYEEDYDPKAEEEEEEEEEWEGPQPLAFNKRKNSYNLKGQINRNQQRKQKLPQDGSAEEGHYEDAGYYFNHANHDFKPSQSKLNFVQQNMMNQITQLRRQQQAQQTSKPTFLLRRNGQIVYLAPQLLQVPQINPNKVSGRPTNKPLPNRYPQPVLMIPLKKKGQPTKYISVPWNQLGISNLNQLASLTDGTQSKPLILIIPQGALRKMQQSDNTQKKPSMTADAEAAEAHDSKPMHVQPVATADVAMSIQSEAKPTVITPAIVREQSPPAQSNQEEKDKNTSSESLEEEDHPTKFIVVPDEATTNTKMSRSAYRQILDFFYRQRLQRQLNNETASPSPNVNKAGEQLVPVEVVAETEVVEATTESPLTLESPDIEPKSADETANKSVESKI